MGFRFNGSSSVWFRGSVFSRFFSHDMHMEQPPLEIEFGTRNIQKGKTSKLVMKCGSYHGPATLVAEIWDGFRKCENHTDTLIELDDKIIFRHGTATSKVTFNCNPSQFNLSQLFLHVTVTCDKRSPSISLQVAIPFARGAKAKTERVEQSKRPRADEVAISQPEPAELTVWHSNQILLIKIMAQLVISPDATKETNSNSIQEVLKASFSRDKLVCYLLRVSGSTPGHLVIEYIDENGLNQTQICVYRKCNCYDHAMLADIGEVPLIRWAPSGSDQQNWFVSLPNLLSATPELAKAKIAVKYAHLVASIPTKMPLQPEDFLDLTSC